MRKVNKKISKTIDQMITKWCKNNPLVSMIRSRNELFFNEFKEALKDLLYEQYTIQGGIAI